MILHARTQTAVRNAAVLAGALLAMPPVHAAGLDEVGEFEDATIGVERNATDGDTEIVMTAKPLTDLGLKRLSLFSPRWRQVLEVDAPARSRGLREYLFESPEPTESAILALYPEGEYLYFGVATNGRIFMGSAHLSHELPGETLLIAPLQDELVPAGSLTIRWAAVPDAAHYILELENESADPEQTLSIVLPADVTSFSVPPTFVVAGSDYQVGVATVHENGNSVWVEATFSTVQ
jgi:hypothetical protein